MFRVLIVCTGNQCRSPMAEGILSRLLADELGVRPRDLIDRGIHVLSAGTGNTPPASAGVPSSAGANVHDPVAGTHWGTA